MGKPSKRSGGKDSCTDAPYADDIATLAPLLSAAAEKHIPVLYREVLSFAPLRDNALIVDGTLGMGGHSEGLLMLARLRGLKGVRLLGLDRDREALDLAAERLRVFEDQVRLVYSPFSAVASVLESEGWGPVDFALIDIGVSSLQIDTPERGFSFLSDGPLDMRMDTGQGQPASAFINKAPVQKLKEVIASLGEDPMAGKIARAIDDARSQKRIESTKELAVVVERAYPPKWRATSRNHPATRTFQALRMLVNDELGELERYLHSMAPLLRSGGRMAVITFHSLEDRLVKHFFRDQAAGCRCPRHIPVCVCGEQPKMRIVTKKPVLPTAGEIAANSRAGSAKLRVAEKL